MSNLDNEIDTVTPPALAWSRVTGAAFEDVMESVIGFIPHGLGVIYDRILKRLPLLGALFVHAWVEQLLKLISGITIGKGIARDVSRFVFKPVGLFVGFIIGSVYVMPMGSQRQYQGQWGNVLRKFAGPVVGAALLGLGLCAMLEILFGVYVFPLSVMLNYVTFGLIGAGVGVLIQWIILYAVHVVKNTQANSQQAVYVKAQELCKSVTVLARRQAKGRILTEAQDIIQQVNGAQSQQHLERYFEEKYGCIAQPIHEKIDRHIQYYTDRACHGDQRAFNKLKELYFTGKHPQGKITVLTQLLNKIFNQRAVMKLKDEVDTTFDKWLYARTV